MTARTCRQLTISCSLRRQEIVPKQMQLQLVHIMVCLAYLDTIVMLITNPCQAITICTVLLVKAALQIQNQGTILMWMANLCQAITICTAQQVKQSTRTQNQARISGYLRPVIYIHTDLTPTKRNQQTKHTVECTCSATTSASPREEAHMHTRLTQTRMTQTTKHTVECTCSAII